MARWEFLQHNDVFVELDKDLKKMSTMRLDAVGDLVTIRSLVGLKFVLKEFFKRNIRYQVLGKGANTLLSEKSPIPYLFLDFFFDRMILESFHEEYRLPASLSLALLTVHAHRFGLRGWEVFTGVPATLGGAIFMNAGTNLGDIGPLVKRVEVVQKNGEEKTVHINEQSFSYRKNHFLVEGDIIYEVVLKHFGVDPEIPTKIHNYLEMRNRTQPLKEWTCGCMFKNYRNDNSGTTCRAGHFIDIIGLKGFMVKNLQISQKHANFMENKGSATQKEVVGMIEAVKQELRLQFGVDFETEVEF